MRNYRGFARNFDPNPMGPVPEPKTIKKNQKCQKVSKTLKRFFLPVGETARLYMSFVRSSCDDASLRCSKQGGALLVFMPGAAEINELITKLHELEGIRER